MIRRFKEDTASQQHLSQESLALASMVRDDPTQAARRAARRPYYKQHGGQRGKVGSEFET